MINICPLYSICINFSRNKSGVVIIHRLFLYVCPSQGPWAPTLIQRDKVIRINHAHAETTGSKTWIIPYYDLQLTIKIERIYREYQKEYFYSVYIKPDGKQIVSIKKPGEVFAEDIITFNIEDFVF